MPTLSVYDHERFTRIVHNQYEVISRGQALACRMTRQAIAHRLRPNGPWQKMLPGTYRCTTGPETEDQRAMAALVYAGEDSVITGAIAVRRHGMKCAGLNVIDVLVPDRTRRKSTAFVQIQRTTRMPKTVYTTRSLRFAPPPRAVADATRSMKRFADVQALVAEALQKRYCTLAELITELNEGPSSGSRWLRTALAEVSDGARSNAEIDLKKIIERSDLERPVYNAMLYAADGTFLGCADAWFPRAGVAAEVDSREYHLSPKDYEETVKHHNRMAKAGIKVLHWLPSTIRKSPGAVLGDLYAATKSGYNNPPLPIRVLTEGE